MEAVYIQELDQLIDKINAQLRDNKYLSNKYLNEWLDSKMKIIEDDKIDDIIFQDSRYTELNADNFLSEAYEEIDPIEIEIETTAKKIFAYIQNIYSSKLYDSPGFDPAYERFIESIRAIISDIPIRNTLDLPAKYFRINDDYISTCRENAINTLSFTYSTTPMKMYSHFISKKSGIYARSSEYLKDYILAIVRNLQTTRNDLVMIMINLQLLKNTFKSYKKYFTEKAINNCY